MLVCLLLAERVSSLYKYLKTKYIRFRTVCQSNIYSCTCNKGFRRPEHFVLFLYFHCVVDFERNMFYMRNENKLNKSTLV